MVNTLITIGFNLISLLILVSGIFSAIKNGVRVSLIKFILTLGAGVACYFITPVIVNNITIIAVGEETLGTILGGLGISIGTISSAIFTLCFLLTYAFNLIICNIVRHILVKKLRNKTLNKAKMARAKSINSRAEKAARKSEWKALNLKFKEGRRWHHRISTIFLGTITAIIAIFVVLLPVKYIGNDLESTRIKDSYQYTLNGVICDIEGFDFSDWLLQLESDDNEEEAPSCEHLFVEGVCEHCGEPETVTGE